MPGRGHACILCEHGGLLRSLRAILQFPSHCYPLTIPKSYKGGEREICYPEFCHAMKALLTDEPSDACLTWAESYPEGVTTRVISTAEAQLMVAEAPIDRVSALAAARSGSPGDRGAGERPRPPSRSASR